MTPFKRISVLLVALSASAASVQANELPKRSKRVQVFEQAGLHQELDGLDELDRDLLYIRAKTAELAVLMRAYPKMPREKLEKLRTLILQSPSQAQAQSQAQAR